MNTLKLFIRRSTFPQVELELGRFSMSGTSLIDLLWSIPSLVRLTLERITYANDFFPTLSRAKRQSSGNDSVPGSSACSFVNAAESLCRRQPARAVHRHGVQRSRVQEAVPELQGTETGGVYWGREVHVEKCDLQLRFARFSRRRRWSGLS
jgi:hypothetical protein